MYLPEKSENGRHRLPEVPLRHLRPTRHLLM